LSHPDTTSGRETDRGANGSTGKSQWARARARNILDRREVGRCVIDSLEWQFYRRSLSFRNLFFISPFKRSSGERKFERKKNQKRKWPSIGGGHIARPRFLEIGDSHFPLS